MDNKLISPSSKGTIVKIEAQSEISDIDVYKEVLSNRFMEANTSEDCEKLLVLRQRVQELDVETRRLNYAQKLAEVQLQQAQQKAFLQNGQQIGAIVASITIGAFLLPTFPLGGLLFLILGLAKPLGYSLGEIGNFLDSLKGFPKDSNEIMIDGSEENNKDEESRNARP